MDSTDTGDLGKTNWGDETSKALREAGFKIVRFGDIGMIYVGQVNYSDVPHGHGYMYLSNGDLHEGTFKEGRAQGEGTFYTKSGSEMTGSWEENKRVGVFKVVDAKGVHWTEKYNKTGKKIGRKKDKIKTANPEFKEGCGEEVLEFLEELAPADSPARKCWNCNGLGRERSNHAWSCRMHKGRWSQDRTYRGKGERGVWSCCGREEKSEPGCCFQGHNFQ